MVPPDPPAASDPARPRAPRSAVVDLGSNSVRLVVFEGRSRNPMVIFNEKTTARLGRGLENTGRLNPEGVQQTLALMGRFYAVARSLGAEPFEVLATAAARDAANGPEFTARLRALMPGVPIRTLSGEEEADYAATGVLCGVPDADGIMADIGGGSLELVHLDHGAKRQARTLKLGVIRLSDRADGDLERARAIVEADLDTVDWLPAAGGRTLYLVGGAFRALARIQIARSFYPLNIVHQYELGRDEAREMASFIAGAGRRALERIPGAPRKRLEDAPFAAIVLRRLLRRLSPDRVVFCVDGVREGWYMRSVAPEVLTQDPLDAASRDLSDRLARNPALPPALLDWTTPLFTAGPNGESDRGRRTRSSACWISDTGALDHPEYRAEQSFLRILRLPGMALDHPTRAFLALVLAVRYEAPTDSAFVEPARRLLDAAEFRRAELLGHALSLAYALCAGVPDLLGSTALAVSGDRLQLRLSRERTMFGGETVTRRLERLAACAGLVPDLVTA